MYLFLTYISYENIIVIFLLFAAQKSELFSILLAPFAWCSKHTAVLDKKLLSILLF